MKNPTDLGFICLLSGGGPLLNILMQSSEGGTLLRSEVGVDKISMSEEDFSPVDPEMIELGSGVVITCLVMEGFSHFPRQQMPKHLPPLEQSSHLEDDLGSTLLKFGRKLSAFFILQFFSISSIMTLVALQSVEMGSSKDAFSLTSLEA